MTATINLVYYVFSKSAYEFIENITLGNYLKSNTKTSINNITGTLKAYFYYQLNIHIDRNNG